VLNPWPRWKPARHNPCRAPNAGRVRPGVETLEGRWVLSPAYGLTTTNGLFTFDTDNPAAVSAVTPVTGLAAGDTLEAIDGLTDTQLVGLGRNGTTGRLSRINKATPGAAGGPGPFPAARAGRPGGPLRPPVTWVACPGLVTPPWWPWPVPPKPASPPLLRAGLPGGHPLLEQRLDAGSGLVCEDAENE
jgi:hypothetical protein